MSNESGDRTSILQILHFMAYGMCFPLVLARLSLVSPHILMHPEGLENGDKNQGQEGWIFLIALDKNMIQMEC